MRVLPEKRQTLLFSATMTQGLIAMQQHALPHAHCFQVASRAQDASSQPQSMSNSRARYWVQEFAEHQSKAGELGWSTSILSRHLANS